MHITVVVHNISIQLCAILPVLFVCLNLSCVLTSGALDEALRNWKHKSKDWHSCNSSCSTERWVSFEQSQVTLVLPLNIFCDLCLFVYTMCVLGITDMIHHGGTGGKASDSKWVIGDLCGLRFVITTKCCNHKRYWCPWCCSVLSGTGVQQCDRKVLCLQYMNRQTPSIQQLVNITILTWQCHILK